jgi:hypothetical protein
MHNVSFNCCVEAAKVGIGSHHQVPLLAEHATPGTCRQDGHHVVHHRGLEMNTGHDVQFSLVHVVRSRRACRAPEDCLTIIIIIITITRFPVRRLGVHLNHP